MSFDPYAVLDVPHDADDKTIKAAWRKKSSEAHPDREDGDEELQSQLNQAKDILLDPDRRAQYDAGNGTGKAKSVDDEALQLLLDLMSQLVSDPAITSRFKSVHKAIQSGLSSRATEIELAIQQADVEHKRLERLKGKLLAKNGPNYFDDMCQKRLDAVEKSRAEMVRDQEITALSIAMLNNDYESPAEDDTAMMSDRVFLSLTGRRL